MKKVLSLLVGIFIVFTLVSCSNDNITSEKDTQNPGGETEPMTVAEVLEQDDLTYVEVKAIVAGFDAGVKHVVIEDEDEIARIQIYSGMGYPYLKVGDEVLVTGYRTYDRSTDRLEPESLEVLSSGNPTSKDNPTVIDYSELNDWTNENRTNSNILFKYYTFTNVPIVSKSSTYTFIDDAYDDEPEGRGLKIGVKDTSVYSPDNLVEGATYTFTALVYGSSDDFFDETRDGTVLRLSIMSADDVTIHGDEASITHTGKTVFLVGDTEPDWTTYFNVLDPTDGEITVTEEMIIENVDMETEGTYTVELFFQNSIGYPNEYTIEVEVSNTGKSVTDALNAEVGTEMLVEGVVVGYGLNKDTKKPIIIEDPENGNAIEIWGNSSYDEVEIGDKILVYSGAIVREKDQPRLDKHQLISILSSDNELSEAKVIEDIALWTASVVENKTVIFGRYTFTATMVDASSSDSYKYFYLGDEVERNLKFAVHKDSLVSFEWVEGNTYTVTGVVYGVSDPISVLDDPNSTKEPTIRFGIMNIEDIEELS